MSTPRAVAPLPMAALVLASGAFALACSTALVAGMVSPAAVAAVVLIGAAWALLRRLLPLPVDMAGTAVVAFLAMQVADRLGEESLSGRAGLTNPASYPRLSAIALAVTVVVAFASRARARALLAGSLVLLVLALTSPNLPAASLVLVAWTLLAAAAFVAERTGADDELVRAATGDLPLRSRRERGRPWVRAGLALAVVGLLGTLASVVRPPSLSASASDASFWERFGPQEGSDTGGSAAEMLSSPTLDTSARPQPTDRVLLEVRADRASLWRGEAYDVFDGRTWSRSADLEQTRPVRFMRGSFLLTTPPDVLARGYDPTVPRAELVQVVEVRELRSDLVFAASVPYTVLATASGAAIGEDGRVQLAEPLTEGARYVVRSDQLLVTGPILRDHDPLDGPLPEIVASRYLQLPDDIPARVLALAEEITADAPTAFDKVRAIERWLAANVEYTLSVPPLPVGADAVDQFLFVDRQGWCVQIASAMAVLLRAEGVPTRVATGFAPGERGLFDRTFTVRDSDAHAWVEVWFPGIGWQGFDPTASVPLAGEADEPLLERVRDWFAALWLPVLVALGAAVLVVGLVALVRRRQVSGWAARLTAQLDRESRRRGLPRPASRTVAAHVALLVRGPWPDQRLVEVATLVERAAYAGDVPSAEDAERAAAALRAASRDHPAPRWWRRLRPRIG